MAGGANSLAAIALGFDYRRSQQANCKTSKG
jgi:hypothetical protein